MMRQSSFASTSVADAIRAKIPPSFWASPTLGRASGGTRARMATVGPAFERPTYNLDPNWQVPVSGALGADYPLWKFAHANASVLIGLKVKSIADLSLVRELLEAAGTRDADLDLAVRSLGEIEQLWLSILKVPGRQPSVLILASGRIPEAATDGLRANGISARYVDPNTVILGQRTEVNASLARLLAKAEVKPMRDDWNDSHLWMAASGSELAAMVGPGKAPVGVTRLTAALTMAQTAAIRMTLETATPVAARNLNAQLDKDPSKAAVLVNAPDVKRELQGNRILMSGEAPLDHEVVRGQLKAMLKPVIEICQQISVRRKAAVIVGLDEGPKVVYQK